MQNSMPASSRQAIMRSTRQSVARKNDTPKSLQNSTLRSSNTINTPIPVSLTANKPAPQIDPTSAAHVNPLPAHLSINTQRNNPYSQTKSPAHNLPINPSADQYMTQPPNQYLTQAPGQFPNQPVNQFTHLSMTPPSNTGSDPRPGDGYRDCASDYHALQVLPLGATNVAKQLYDMPIVRQLVLRKNREMSRLEKGADNLEAALAQQRGTLRPIAEQCVSCAKNGGPFANGCVVVKDKFNHSCANCRYNGEGGRCSLKPDHNNSRRGVRKNAAEKKTAVRKMTVEARNQRLIEICKEIAKLYTEEAAIRELNREDELVANGFVPGGQNGMESMIDPNLENGRGGDYDEEDEDRRMLESQLHG